MGSRGFLHDVRESQHLPRTMWRHLEEFKTESGLIRTVLYKTTQVAMERKVPKCGKFGRSQGQRRGSRGRFGMRGVGTLAN